MNAHPLPGCVDVTPSSITSVVTIGVALLFKLNVPAAQLINLIVTPLDVACVPVFLYLGELLVGAPHVSLAPSTLMEAVGKSISGALHQYGWAIFHAILGWTVFAPVGTALLFFALRPLLALYLTQRKSA